MSDTSPARATPLSTTVSSVRWNALVLAPGSPLPIGAWLSGNGVNFSLFSRNATAVELLLFESATDRLPAATIKLDPVRNHTGDIWHVWVADLQEGQAYAYRVDGEYAPQKGMRFNRNKVLLDPYGRAFSGISTMDVDRALGYDPQSPDLDLSFSSDDNVASAARSVVVNPGFDWRGDLPIRRPWSQTIIYETHVRGLTVHPSSGVAHRGCYRGVVEKIPYFKQLGITAIELLPVQEFNENEMRRLNPIDGQPLRNYWGYNSVGFFAPKGSYASDYTAGAQVAEFKEMVRELHAAGIEVILDIALTHSAENNELGPTLSFRGIENSIYYLLADGGRRYLDFSGCGNTLNCNHPVVREFILDCLRHWAVEMHVDGFRFDLAAILGRDESGRLAGNAPLLERIAEEPILRGLKLIAEAWDAGGAYLVGGFPGLRWSEWNGRYRDEVRRFWRGDPGMAGAFASRLCGSADIYQREGRQPLNSINFVTCHDGFTLADLVSYEHKHNQANGEANRDGTNDNFSHNFGVEGETTDAAINALRLRQRKNLLATLMLSRGVPMLLGGDEFGRTQRGNNNAYCQDNEISWYDWTLLERNRELFRFVQELIAFRQEHFVVARESFYTADEVIWFNPQGDYPDWAATGSTLGCVIHDIQPPHESLCLLANASAATVEFHPPAPAPGFSSWRVVIDTAAPSPADIVPISQARPLTLPPRVVAAPHSFVMLISTK
jgi:isoamylase